MRKAYIGAVILSLFTLAGCQDDDKQIASVSPDALKQGTVILNYWATWCSPCKAEIPMLNKFYSSHKDQVKLYGVNYDGLDKAALSTAIKKFSIEFPVLASNPGDALGFKTFAVVPTTVIMRNGKVIKTLQGPQTVHSLDQAIKTA